MKSYALGLIGGLATLVSSSPNSYQEGSCVCPAAETVTISESYLPSGTNIPGQYPAGQNPPSQLTPDTSDQYNPDKPVQHDYAAITITVTETAPPVTVTNAVTITKYVPNGEPDVTATYPGATYTQPPPPPYQTGTSAIYSNTTSTAYGSRQTHRVEVGTFDGKVQFVPNQINAEIGDVVEYDFLIKSHSLTQSEFLTPCTYNGGFDTGLNQPNPKNESGLFVIPFEVTTKKPQWFYCKQAGSPVSHCNSGMVFGLNPLDKMDQFIQNAINQNLNTNGTASSTAPYQSVKPTSTSSTSTATGAIATVTVGLQNGTVLKFDPPYLPKVAVGQKIHFDFRAANHTLTESSLENPCKKMDGTAIDTNFQNANKGDIPEFKPFDLTIDSDKPRFFYCKQANGTPKGHCSKGMVFSVNTDAATFSQFEQNALATLPKIKGRFAA